MHIGKENPKRRILVLPSPVLSYVGHRESSRLQNPDRRITPSEAIRHLVSACRRRFFVLGYIVEVAILQAISCHTSTYRLDKCLRPENSAEADLKGTPPPKTRRTGAAPCSPGQGGRHPLPHERNQWLHPPAPNGASYFPRLSLTPRTRDCRRLIPRKHEQDCGIELESCTLTDLCDYAAPAAVAGGGGGGDTAEARTSAVGDMEGSSSGAPGSFSAGSFGGSALLVSATMVSGAVLVATLGMVF